MAKNNFKHKKYLTDFFKLYEDILIMTIKIKNKWIENIRA